ncbi:multidrug effflux MFS transporter [Roseovarius sp. LXJ103]|uniref:multidrug effflux MFS transporter n=1 Tax=Roseovarius carneus TaxID=2853164 RepID=UPI000D610D39|nr:multidrug effflux MFS transporter [Roseovarius carneus]MBZ8119783.1 multidrug effflux MFS transporter [Roseovarius carneus]PWE34617.1 Bcr/CflA family drug resistance efflux transporter [Pelagicola sp. LXJ1103]
MSTPKPLSIGEFVVLLAFMISIVALATDIMLPALDLIGAELGVSNPNDVQFIVSALFLGFAVGQALAGPLSDSFGRKPVIYGGYAIFLLGCAMSLWASTWEMMIAGRILQGVGAASPRIVSLALVRDGYAGREMARIMSVVMAVFILVPCIAPALGEGVIALSGWRATFGVLIALAVIAAIWFAARQPETLLPSLRRPFRAATLGAGLREVLRSRIAMGYTLATGLIFGAFLAYLSTAQQIFSITFDRGSLFALYFAIAALAVGAASLVNSLLVMRFGMRRLSVLAVLGLSALSLAFLGPVWAADGLPEFWLFMGWLLASFFCIGILFGNLNAIALEPLGHIAGLGAAMIGSLSNVISLPIAWLIGQQFSGSATPLVVGFAAMGIAAFGAMCWAERGIPRYG